MKPRLLFGIVFSLIARTGFIFIGAALINQFAWVFYLFGLVLLPAAAIISGVAIRTALSVAQSRISNLEPLRNPFFCRRLATVAASAPERAPDPVG